MLLVAMPSNTPANKNEGHRPLHVGDHRRWIQFEPAQIDPRIIPAYLQ
jgi:hypothetical protein